MSSNTVAASTDSVKMNSLPSWAIPAVVAAAIAIGLAGSFILTNEISAFTLGVIAGAVYLVGIYAYSRAVEGGRHALDRAVTGLVTIFFIGALFPLVSVIWTVLSLGYKRFDSTFFTYSMSFVIDDGGGAYHAIIGTLIITTVTSLIAIPIGIFAAIYLVEYGNGNALARAMTFFVDVMTGIPSIVAGLFAVAVFAVVVGPGYQTGLVAAVALAVLMVPVVVRSTEEMLRLVPNDLREASYALGVPRWLTIVKVVIPTSIAGIVTGLTLAIARVIGETAPLLVTAGATARTNFSPFSEYMMTLPVFTYQQYQTSSGGFNATFADRAWAGALTLMIIVMVLNVIARLVSKYFAPKTGR